MDKITAFLTSEMGRRIIAIVLVTLSKAAESGMVPLDYVIPGTSATTGALLAVLGVGVATTSGSQTRK